MNCIKGACNANKPAKWQKIYSSSSFSDVQYLPICSVCVTTMQTVYQKSHLQESLIMHGNKTKTASAHTDRNKMLALIFCFYWLLINLVCLMRIFVIHVYYIHVGASSFLRLVDTESKAMISAIFANDCIIYINVFYLFVVIHFFMHLYKCYSMFFFASFYVHNSKAG